MRSFIALALVLLAIPSLAGELTDEELRESLRAAEAGFAKAFAADDLDAFAAYIHDDALFLGRTPLRGKAAVVAQWSTYFGTDKRPFSWEPKKFELNPSRTMGMTNGPVYDPEGNHVGTFSSVWRRQPDGTWKIIFDGGGDCPRQQ
ncbi:MAG TPA: nuclear transport factor 2 family protein [Thermoanaerobaculia bacterium]|nr:nuclear transport factor 2 family protein [Thermoanaerobaculia bacterium]